MCWMESFKAKSASSIKKDMSLLGSLICSFIPALSWFHNAWSNTYLTDNFFKILIKMHFRLLTLLIHLLPRQVSYCSGSQRSVSDCIYPKNWQHPSSGLSTMVKSAMVKTEVCVYLGEKAPEYTDCCISHYSCQNISMFLTLSSATAITCIEKHGTAHSNQTKHLFLAQQHCTLTH